MRAVRQKALSLVMVTPLGCLNTNSMVLRDNGKSGFAYSR